MKAFSRILLCLVLCAIGSAVMAQAAVVEAAGKAAPPEMLNTELSLYWDWRIRRWESLITREAERRSLDPDLLAALIWMESRGDATAIGPQGSTGLMQVMPREAGFSWRPEQKVLLDPSVNVTWGTRTFSIIMHQAEGDVFHALAAYNGGWERVTSRRPRVFASIILREYSQVLRMRAGLTGRTLIFLAVREPGPNGPTIRGPIWVIDSERDDVYLYGAQNWTPEGVPLIPEIDPFAVLVYLEDEEAGCICEASMWLYDHDREQWVEGQPMGEQGIGEEPDLAPGETSSFLRLPYLHWD